MSSLTKSIVFSALLACVFAKDTILPDNYQPFHGSLPKNEELRCGGIVQGDQGIVSYKVTEALAPNERCVWTVRAPNATSYEVFIASLGLPGSLIINGLGYRSRTAYSVPTEGGTTVNITESNVLVVTFYTGNITANSTGFVLSYVASTSGTAERATGASSTDVIVAGDLGTVKHPPGKDTLYSNYDVSVFLFPPVNNYWTEEGTVDIVYNELGLEGDSTIDRVMVYVFDSSYNPSYKWRFVGYIQGGTSATAIRWNDLTMIVFESDASVVNKGFILTSSQCT